MGKYDDIFTRKVIGERGFFCPGCKTEWLGLSLQTKDLTCDMRQVFLTDIGMWQMPRHPGEQPQQLFTTGNVEALGECSVCRMYVTFEVICVEGVPESVRVDYTTHKTNPPHDIQRMYAMRALKHMTPEQRLEVFSEFCTHCGDDNPRCQCSNDE